VVGYRYAIGAMVEQKLVGIVIVGRPVAKAVDWRRVIEVTRLVSDGTKNVCSFLYAKAARAAAEMGYDAIQTFILEEEPGTSLKAAGWEFVRSSPGGTWTHNEAQQLRLDGPVRRIDQPLGRKQLWARALTDEGRGIIERQRSA
jgi:hypothetical protein